MRKIADTELFSKCPEIHPMIYAYKDTNPQYRGLLKVGYTVVDVDARVAQQYPTKRPEGVVPYKIMYRGSAMRTDGSVFTDHEVHRILKHKGFHKSGEWFRCTAPESAVVFVYCI